MKINNNITAYITNNSLLKSEKMFANSTAKLSSGFKINKAGDDPTGYA
ncbi:MAG: flagellin, partial [Lachnospiraceae bacterium]|nr:flagellin [Lachnospiraceae bacterium]